MKTKETDFNGVFDSPLSDYEQVFRPLLNGSGFREVLSQVGPEARPLVLDLMTSGVNLVSLSDVASCLAVGYQRSREMTVQELAAQDVTYVHTDLTELGAWREIDAWLSRKGIPGGRAGFSLAMTRPEGAFYGRFWDFDHFCDLMLFPTLERLVSGGFIFFQTPFRAFIPEGEGRMRLNTSFQTEGMANLETLVLNLKGCGYEADLKPANFGGESRPYFDLLLMVRKVQENA